MTKLVDFSYPYLRLARKYDLPYHHVLAMADYLTHGRYQTLGTHGQEILATLLINASNELVRDLCWSAKEFHRIQVEGWEVKE